MQPKEILDILHVAERLKDATRHCDTSGGRRESVAEHCWRAAFMAMLLQEDFPQADMNKVIRMCLIHDMGEAFTGDIPCFEKTEADEDVEEDRLAAWVSGLSEPLRGELQALYREMDALQTTEAKIYKAIDGMEAVIQHNEADIASWLPLEYDLQMTYASNRAAFSPVLQELREAIRSETEKKIKQNNTP